MSFNDISGQNFHTDRTLGKSHENGIKTLKLDITVFWKKTACIFATSKIAANNIDISLVTENFE